MIILDKPYVSTFLQKTVRDLGIPVLNCSEDDDLISLNNLKISNEDDFRKIAKAQSPLLLYCNSENSLQWIYRNLEDTGIPKAIELFKEKVTFRQLVQRIYPDFFFQEVTYNQLPNIDISKINKPFIIKPAIGFFSMGVYKVSRDNEWELIVGSIQQEMQKVQGLYPIEVMNSSKFIIEQYIEGEEFAIDAYYDGNGKPVILNILKHPFSSDGDVSDRIYFTSQNIMREQLATFTAVLASIGEATGIANFPVHVEVRVDKNGKVIPIEVNPMRFAGWCTTDLAYYAYDLNVYDYYFNQKVPAWDQILQTVDDQLYGIVIADVPKHLDTKKIAGIDYEGFSSNFSNLLELRRINYNQYPVFAFSFIKVDNNSDEVDKILQLDWSPYIHLIND